MDKKQLIELLSRDSVEITSPPEISPDRPVTEVMSTNTSQRMPEAVMRRQPIKIRLEIEVSDYECFERFPESLFLTPLKDGE